MKFIHQLWEKNLKATKGSALNNNYFNLLHSCIYILYLKENASSLVSSLSRKEWNISFENVDHVDSEFDSNLFIN